MPSRHRLLVLVVLVVPGCGSGADPAPDPLAALAAKLERTPEWNEKPFAPAQGAALDLDPPAFVWLPVPGHGGGYVLAVSRGEGFPEGGETLAEDVPMSVYVPRRALGPGRWFWRVGVRAGDGRTAWSTTRAFTIADGARPWPLPDVDALVRKVPGDRPRLFFTRDDAARVRSELPYAMEREYEFLLIEGRRAVGQKLPAEPRAVEAQGPKRDAEFARIFRATRPPMDAMETCALAYLLSGDRRFGLEAKRRILHFFAWDPEGPTGLGHNPEPAMWMMQRGVRAYDWTWELFEPQERAAVEAAMKARARQFFHRLRGLPFESRPFHSHAARDLGFLGEASLCFAHEWPEAREWLDYVLSLFWSVYPAWAGDDGGWNEGPTYWTAYMGFALHFAAALRKATGADLVQKPFFRNTPYYKLYANPPYARLSPFGDGHEGPPGLASGEVMYAFSTLLGDPYARWYAETVGSGPGNGPLGFSLYDPGVRARPPSDLPQARHFAGAGVVAMHAALAGPKNNAYLVMRSSPLGPVSHAHADQNAFAVEAFGEPLAIASGYYPYFNSPHHQEWTRQTKAACSVTVDGGRGQIGRSAEGAGRIAAFETGAEYDYALGDASSAYGKLLTKFHRHVLHVRPGTFVVVDELAAPAPVRFEWRLHALEKMEVAPEQRQVVTRRGAARMRTTLVAPAALRFDQTGRFTPPPENKAPDQWHLTVSTAGKEISTVFFAVLWPYREGRAPPPVERIAQGDLLGAAWTDGSARHEVLFSPEGVRTRDVRTEARLAAVRREDGKVAVWTSPE